MRRSVVTIDADATAALAAAQCHEQDIGSLVVVEGGDPVGIVTGQDLLDVLGHVDDPGAYPLRRTMSSPIVTTAPETSVDEAVLTMAEHDVARLVVLDDGTLAGIVSSNDIARYAPQVFHRHELESGSTAREETHSIRPETAYEMSDWTFEYLTDSPDDLGVGDRVEFSKTIREQDVRTFAAASGDTNRIHIDPEYAEQTRFGRRIVHGTLVSGVISAALARLPGLTIYLSQDLSFRAPVDIGDRVTAVCEIIGTFGQDKYELTTDVYSGGERVIEGQATVLIDAPSELFGSKPSRS